MSIAADLGTGGDTVPPWGATAVRSAVAMLPAAHDIADRSVRWVREHDPDYAELVTVGELRHASRLCVRLVLTRVAGQAVDNELGAAPERIGRGRAAQAAPLEAVLRALRIDYRLVWEAMLDLAATTDDLDMLELLTDGAARVWDVIDEVSVGVAAAYREVEAELRRSSEEQARVLMAALLRGTAPLGSTVRQAALHIGLEAHERFVACCVDVNSAVISEESLRRALARAGMRSAWYTESGIHLGVVQIGSEPPQAVAAALAATGEVRAGLSLALPGLAAVRENVWQAEAALRAIPAGEAGTAVIETHLLASIAGAAQDLSALLSREVLGPLSELKPPERARILRTVEAYVERGGSVASTAAALHYHRNTIINHLRQFEQHTGRSLREPRDLAHIVLALDAAKISG